MAIYANAATMPETTNEACKDWNCSVLIMLESDTSIRKDVTIKIKKPKD